MNKEIGRLTLTVEEGQDVTIGAVTVRVIQIGGNRLGRRRARILITAPKTTQILRDNAKKTAPLHLAARPPKESFDG